jgi:hypothetical protein
MPEVYDITLRDTDAPSVIRRLREGQVEDDSLTDWLTNPPITWEKAAAGEHNG